VESQLNSFIYGLQPRTPKQAVELWILGVENRSGAVQYAVLSPPLQNLTRKQFEERGWVTGQSSPWVANVHFVKVNKISDTKVQYTISYDLLTSYANFGRGHKVITVEMNPEPYRTNWFITKILSTYFQNEGVTPSETLSKQK
jgi:hypothetical protein